MKLNKLKMGAIIDVSTPLPGSKNSVAINNINIAGPQRSVRANEFAIALGKIPRATLKPSSGEIGIKLNAASKRFQNTNDASR